MRKDESKYFIEPFYSTEGWCLRSAYKFPRREYLAADTETKLYYNNEIIDEDTAYNLYKNNGNMWFKLNVEVRAYAFILSDGVDTVIFQNIIDFMRACGMFHVKRVFWYNAKFDFAIFDYHFLTKDWHDATTELEKNNRYHKFPHKTFINLAGDFGQRYELRIWHEYINNKCERKVANWKMIDVCNISAGGLARNLIDWDIHDRDDKPVRKLTMDYAYDTIESAFEYMEIDAKGLYLLAEKIDKTFYEITKLSLFNGDYLTAGGLAKKVMLKMTFKRIDYKECIQAFKLCFPMDKDIDEYLRNNCLYKGGKCLINPKYVNKPLKNVYKYDINSMYPFQLRSMMYPIGNGRKITKNITIKDNHLYVFAISNIHGVLRNTAVPVWQDRLSDEYVDVIDEPSMRLIWYEELVEIEKWYELEYNVDYVLEYEARRLPGMIQFIDKFYEIKRTSCGSKKSCSKIILNSSYGKLAQRIERLICTYELNEHGIVHLVSRGTEYDENSMMSVLVGSRVTALARVQLMQYINKICAGNPRDNFIYCDTDSVISFTPFNDCDDAEIGKMKFEGNFENAIFLAPKSYLLENAGEYEVHCKGVNVNAVKGELLNVVAFEEACAIFSPDRLFKSLSGINVRGGKALVYIDKVIVRKEVVNIKKGEIISEIFNKDIDNI